MRNKSCQLWLTVLMGLLTTEFTAQQPPESPVLPLTLLFHRPQKPYSNVTLQTTTLLQLLSATRK